MCVQCNKLRDNLIISENYMTNRSNIQSGDLLIWSRDKNSRISNIYLNLIRFFTRSEFAHVAVAWRLEGRLYIVEATMPVVRLSPIRDDDSFYHIPMGVQWSSKAEDFLLDKIGLFYSLLDAARGYFGITTQKDSRWQCAELCNYFYRELDIDLGEDLTPSGLVKTALSISERPLSYMPEVQQLPASTIGAT